LLRKLVILTIDFHTEPKRFAIEIDHIGTKGRLTTKLQPLKPPPSQTIPKHFLRRRRIPAQLPRPISHLTGIPLHQSAVPLALRERG